MLGVLYFSIGILQIMIKKEYMQILCCAKTHQALKDIKNGNSLYPTQNT